MTTITHTQPALAGGAVPLPMPRPGAGAPAAGLTGADVLRILRQRLVLILFLWFFFIALTAVGTYLAMRYFPKYKSTALIKVQSINPADVLNPLEPTESRQEDVLRLLQDEALRVVSPSVLSEALKDTDLRGTQWFREAEEEALEEGEDVLDIMGDTITAVPLTDTNYVGVSASWKVQKEVPILINTTVEKYLEIINEQQRGWIRESTEQLDEEISRVQRTLVTKEDELEGVRDQVSEAKRREVEEKVLTLTALATELQVSMDSRRVLYEQIQQVGPDSLPITPDIQALVNVDPTVVPFDRAAREAEENLNSARARYGENHRVVREARIARDAAAERAATARAERINALQSEQVDQARRQFVEAQEQLISVRDHLNEARAEQQDLEAKYQNFLRLQEEAERYKTQLAQLQEQKHQLEMTLRAKRTVQVNVDQWAIEPKRLSSPNVLVWVPAGTLLGLAISVGLALLLDVADKSVRTPRDVQRQAIQVLGMIPATEDEEIEITRVETAVLDAPNSIVAEAFRNLRANLFFCAPAEHQGAILVTSPSGANGKTTVAINLAISIALSGRRVLLVDTNFRRASLPRIFPDMRSEGLSNLLIGEALLDDVVSPTSVPGLDVLSAGPPPPNPAELLGSSYLRDLLVDARSRYDQIILDGPPVLLVSDAMVLAGAVDGVLLVCQYRATSRGALQRTQQQLEAINARIFGAVLNRVETRAGGYFRKAYREFYDYQEPGERGEGLPRQLQPSETGEQLESASAAEEGAGAAGDEAPHEGAADLGSTVASLEGGTDGSATGTGFEGGVADSTEAPSDEAPSSDEQFPAAGDHSFEAEDASGASIRGEDLLEGDLDLEIENLQGETLLTDDEAIDLGGAGDTDVEEDPDAPPPNDGSSPDEPR